MSVQAIALVLEHSKSTGSDRLVLISIANHDGDGGSWPTISTLCRETMLGDRTVHESLRRLQGLGELKVHINAGGTMDWRGDRRPNRYEITINGVADLATPSGDYGVASCAERGGKLPRHGVAELATQTIQEPPTKPSISRATIDHGFAEFWKTFPKRVAKRAALQAYERAVKREQQACGQGVYVAIVNIQRGAERYARVRLNQDPQFTAQPASWLNADRWEDDFGRAAARVREDSTGRPIEPEGDREASKGKTYAQQITGIDDPVEAALALRAAKSGEGD